MVRTDSFLSSCPSDRPAHPGADQLSRTVAPAPAGTGNVESFHRRVQTLDVGPRWGLHTAVSCWRTRSSDGPTVPESLPYLHTEMTQATPHPGVLFVSAPAPAQRS